jgi:hypothetical protein
LVFFALLLLWRYAFIAVALAVVIQICRISPTCLTIDSKLPLPHLLCGQRAHIGEFGEERRN